MIYGVEHNRALRSIVDKEVKILRDFLLGSIRLALARVAHHKVRAVPFTGGVIVADNCARHVYALRLQANQPVQPRLAGKLEQ